MDGEHSHVHHHEVEELIETLEVMHPDTPYISAEHVLRELKTKRQRRWRTQKVQDGFKLIQTSVIPLLAAWIGKLVAKWTVRHILHIDVPVIDFPVD
mmetsp:Transcript_1080/g.1492  ORF Transcript_1080/g.1492 Transcript_1080/m.1492 type:complete len:97 (+) Transcript_1080:2479-2769(+)